MKHGTLLLVFGGPLSKVVMDNMDYIDRSDKMDFFLLLHLRFWWEILKFAINVPTRPKTKLFNTQLKEKYSLFKNTHNTTNIHQNQRSITKKSSFYQPTPYNLVTHHTITR